MKKYTISLTEEEINKILFVLAERPYGEVFELIESIRKQALSQDNDHEVM